MNRTANDAISTVHFWKDFYIVNLSFGKIKEKLETNFVNDLNSLPATFLDFEEKFYNFFMVKYILK